VFIAKHPASGPFTVSPLLIEEAESEELNTKSVLYNGALLIVEGLPLLQALALNVALDSTVRTELALRVTRALGRKYLAQQAEAAKADAAVKRKELLKKKKAAARAAARGGDTVADAAAVAAAAAAAVAASKHAAARQAALDANDADRDANEGGNDDSDAGSDAGWMPPPDDADEGSGSDSDGESVFEVQTLPVLTPPGKRRTAAKTALPLAGATLQGATVTKHGAMRVFNVTAERAEVIGGQRHYNSLELWVIVTGTGSQRVAWIAHEMEDNKVGLFACLLKQAHAAHLMISSLGRIAHLHYPLALPFQTVESLLAHVKVPTVSRIAGSAPGGGRRALGILAPPSTEMAALECILRAAWVRARAQGVPGDVFSTIASTHEELSTVSSRAGLLTLAQFVMLKRHDDAAATAESGAGTVPEGPEICKPAKAVV
jgi:hypothetical protein